MGMRRLLLRLTLEGLIIGLQFSCLRATIELIAIIGDNSFIAQKRLNYNQGCELD